MHSLGMIARAATKVGRVTQPGMIECIVVCMASFEAIIRTVETEFIVFGDVLDCWIEILEKMFV